MSQSGTEARPAPEGERQAIYTGYRGTLAGDRLEELVDSNNKPYAKVPLTLGAGKDVVIMAFGADKVAAIKEAISIGGLTVVHGFLEAKGHLKLHEIGVRIFEGTLHNARSGSTANGPWVNAILTYMDDGEKYSLPFAAFGDHAAALTDLQDGAAVVIDGHVTRERTPDGSYRSVIHVMEARAAAPANDPSPTP